MSADAGKEKPAVSAFLGFSKRLGRQVLMARPSGAPSILEECRIPVKLFVSQHQSPGDILMLTRAVDDLHMSYPGKFVTCIRTPCMELWENNPYDKKIDEADPEAMWYTGESALIQVAGEGAYHFGHSFRKDMEMKLGLPIRQSVPQGAVYLSAQEKSWWGQVYEITGMNLPYWIINAGRKCDFTTKLWEVTRFQDVVDAFPKITWVQIGAKDEGHVHLPLKGDNVIDLVGKTDLRKLVRLVYHSAGVVTSVSLPMHLAAAVEPHPRFLRRTRPCVVIAGGREESTWEAYCNHQYLHTCGMMPCCDNGGCWLSRVEPIGDGDEKDFKSLCVRPVKAKSGQVIPKCMDMITADMVIRAVGGYLECYHYNGAEANWTREK